MAFCEDCGNKLSETTKFCGECGAKAENKIDVPKPEQKKRTKKVKISKPKADVGATSVSTKDNEYLKEFFTTPKFSKPMKKYEPKRPNGIPPKMLLPLCGVVFVSLILHVIIAVTQFEWYEGNKYIAFMDPGMDVNVGVVLSLFTLMGMAVGGFAAVLSLFTTVFLAEEWKKYNKAIQKYENAPKDNVSERAKNIADKKKAWEIMSPEPLFRRLEQAQRIVAKSSYENLGIDERYTTRPPAYCYGPHLEIFGDIFGARTDQTGTGKGADYYKFCEKKGLEGLYTREYDMMVVQFTKNQIMVYKCIFDILEMTKRLEESYEWNYKHVVGINITGDEKEKDLGGGIAVTGTKYLVISAASGDKIEIVLGAGTRQMVGGKQKITALGGEEKIYKVANAAMKNIREAVREGAK